VRACVRHALIVACSSYFLTRAAESYKIDVAREVRGRLTAGSF